MDRKKIYPYSMAVLPLIFFAVFFLIPSTFGYLYAFTDWSAARSAHIRFVGFRNINEMVVNWKLPVAVANTFIYAIVKTVLVTLLGFVFAYILNRKIRSRTALRTIYFIPAVFSALVVGLIFTAMFQTRHGTINNIVNFFGGKSIQWLGSRATAVFSISVAEIWRNVGYAIVITLAALQSVSADYLEAARIDGATEWQLFRNITLPLIMPTVNVNILFSLIYGLKMFDLIYIMTSGGPGNATESFGTLMMNEMAAGRYAQSVAVNLIFTVVLVLISLAYQKFSERWEYTE